MGHHRVAHSLYVITEKTYMMVCVHITIYGVGIHVVSEHLQCITMQEQSIRRLRILISHSTVGSYSSTCTVVIRAVVSRYHAVVLLISNYRITKHLTETGTFVGMNTVPFHLTHILDDIRTVEQECFTSLCSIITFHTIYERTVIRDNV